MKNPIIVDIPEKMEKFFGGKGKMLHPEVSMIKDLITLIPRGKIVTIDIIGKKLASNYGTDVTCPMRTGNAIKKITEAYFEMDANSEIPYWRVVKKNKEIINSKHTSFCASKLEDEGFDLSFLKPGNIKVNFNDSVLFTF